MTITEKVAYFKGLVEGMAIDSSTKEGKLVNALLDVLEDMSLTISDLEDTVASIDEQLEAVDDDLAEVEKDLYGSEDDEDEEDAVCEVECPKCGESVFIDRSIIMDGDAVCPNCGEKLDADQIKCICDDECDCGCQDEDDK